MYKKNYPYLLIAGDLVPTEINNNEFILGDINSLMDTSLKKIWEDSSFRVFNLETPISNEQKFFLKAGTFLSAKSITFKGIKNLNPSLICLANNHIMDLDSKGAYDTINLLKTNKIPYIGFGDNLSSMKDFYSYTIDGKNVGIYNCCEHEFSYADLDNCGTNPFNPLTSLFRIQELKEKCDYLIVIYHGGKELYQYCSPKLKEICHSIAMAGANLIVCQHSHCISCYENYEKSIILYGQGNFIFDLDEKGKWNQLTKKGLLVKLNITDFSVEFIGFHKDGKKIKIDSDQDKADFYIRSREILDDRFVKEKYIQEIKYNSFHYFRQLLSTRILGVIDKNFFNAYFMKKRYKQLRLLLINYFDCEVHMENILTYLKEIDELYRDEQHEN